MPGVICLIVAYKNPKLVQRCVESTFGSYNNIGIHWHDNSSNNIGYTAGMNKLVKRYLDFGGFAALLNQDVQVYPGALDKALEFMLAHPRCAIGGFQLRDSADPDKITHGGTGDAYPAGEHIIGSVASGDCQVSKRFKWLNMAASIIRLEAIREIGLMDERFFLVGSDSDWCYRANLAGWETWYIAEAVALHDGGCSSKPSPEQQAIIDRDMIAFGEKWAKIVQERKALATAE